MNASKPLTLNCAGCGRALDTDPHNEADYATVEIAPGIEAHVCNGGRTINGAKLSCALKAFQKASVCSGCGDKIRDWPIGLLCESCGKKLDLAGRVQRQEETRRSTIELTTYSVATERPAASEEDEAVYEVLKLLAAVTGSERVRESHSAVWVEVTKGQSEAINAIMDALKKLYRTARSAGHNEGRNLIFGLASGKLSIDELEKHEVEKARRARGE